MPSLKYFKLHNWINTLKYRWSLLPPTHRLILLSGGTGAVFVIMLCMLLSPLLQRSPAFSSRPQEVGLVAELSLLANTPLDLLHFSFKKITPSSSQSCSAYVSLDESNSLQNSILVQPISKGDYLCWHHIRKTGIDAKSLEIRKGYRAIGFRIQNPQTASFATPGMKVDAMVYGALMPPLALEDVRVIELFTEADEFFVLLEIPNRKVGQLPKSKGQDISVQLLLKHPEDKAPRLKKSPLTPRIHTG